MSNRCKLIVVSRQLIRVLLVNPSLNNSEVCVVSCDLPVDVLVDDVWPEPNTNNLVFRVSHPSFDEIPDGQRIPEANVKFVVHALKVVDGYVEVPANA